MNKLVLRIFVVVVCVIGSVSFAQKHDPETTSEFGRRAAKIPRTEADTGFQYNEGKMWIEGRKYIMEPRFCGDEKNLQEIERIASREARKVSHAAMKAQSLPTWKAIAAGQDGHNSGRSRDVAFGDGDVVYVATAGGGLWKTDDITPLPGEDVVWVPMTDKLPTLSMGSVAVDPSNKQTVYIGTGEVGPEGYDPSSLDGLGVGLYKSVNGGVDWTMILGSDTAGTRCAKIVIDPASPQTLYVATGTSRTTGQTDGGVIKSIDGGATWTLSNLMSFAPLYMVIDPVETNRLYVSGNGKIFKTANGGDSWTQVTSGLPTSQVGRIAIAIAPKSPNMLYASVGKNDGGQGLHGLYVSTDYGDSWRKLGASQGNYLGIQQFFANTVVVNPSPVSQNQVFGAGLDIWRTNDSGKALTKMTDWTAAVTGNNYSHADVHNLAYNGNVLYSNNDGGLSRSTNGSAWTTTINKGLATLQFVGVDADKDFTFVLGGCQDNGTNIAGINDAQFIESRGGDGGNTFVAPDNPSICYSTYIEKDFYKSTQGGIKGSWQLLSLPLPSPFYPFYDADASGSVVAVGGSGKIMISTAGATDNFPISSNVSIANSRAINVFKSNPSFMWAGSSTNGAFYRSADGGVTWTRSTIPNCGVITGIAVDPLNPANIWVCCQGYSSTGTIKHVYMSTDSGATFTALPNFPNIGCNTITRQNSTGNLFVGTDRGVFFTANQGGEWLQLNDAFPNAMTLTLRVKGLNEDKLLAGTYGRGMFWLDISQLSAVGDKPAFKPGIHFSSVVPNPVSSQNAKVTFTMDNAGVVTSTLLDVLGREVKTLEKAGYSAGTNQFEFATNGLTAGTYIILLTANGTTVSERIIVQ